MKDYIISSESVTQGHPDKLCDKISDAVLDAALKQDPESRVACETLAKKDTVVLAGEMTTTAKLDLDYIIRETALGIGYSSDAYGFNGHTCKIIDMMTQQSPDISQGVTEGMGDFKEQGAGDQGMMFGYACNETKNLLPLSIDLAKKLTNALTRFRESYTALGPDGKSQVAVEYENGKPKRLANVIIAAQHVAEADLNELRKNIKDKVIYPVCDKWMDKNTNLYINATGRFVVGGPTADAGLTGRKIIVDTYGGVGKHGGGAFSGKDPSKVDRSGAYAARYIAKNIVECGLARICEVQLAYVIGVAEPTSILIDTFGTNIALETEIAKAVREIFPVKPADIISQLKLKTPKGWSYQEAAAFGHFGNDKFPWEKCDKKEALMKHFFY
ncbi:MAG: methionine adenosyltransferase [Nanoarchaeota archaeon]|nr:methionine adenosyltransferase [Nanoarchaeota archaeon]